MPIKELLELRIGLVANTAIRKSIRNHSNLQDIVEQAFIVTALEESIIYFNM